MYGAKSRNLTGRQPVLTLDKSINEPTERKIYAICREGNKSGKYDRD